MNHRNMRTGLQWFLWMQTQLHIHIHRKYKLRIHKWIIHICSCPPPPPPFTPVYPYRTPPTEEKWGRKAQPWGENLFKWVWTGQETGEACRKGGEGVGRVQTRAVSTRRREMEEAETQGAQRTMGAHWLSGHVRPKAQREPRAVNHQSCSPLLLSTNSCTLIQTHSRDYWRC